MQVNSYQVETIIVLTGHLLKTTKSSKDHQRRKPYFIDICTCVILYQLKLLELHQILLVGWTFPLIIHDFHSYFISFHHNYIPLHTANPRRRNIRNLNWNNPLHCHLTLTRMKKEMKATTNQVIFNSLLLHLLQCMQGVAKENTCRFAKWLSRLS